MSRTRGAQALHAWRTMWPRRQGVECRKDRGGHRRDARGVQGHRRGDERPARSGGDRPHLEAGRLRQGMIGCAPPEKRCKTGARCRFRNSASSGTSLRAHPLNQETAQMKNAKQGTLPCARPSVLAALSAAVDAGQPGRGQAAAQDAVPAASAAAVPAGAYTVDKAHASAAVPGGPPELLALHRALHEVRRAAAVRSGEPGEVEREGDRRSEVHRCGRRAGGLHGHAGWARNGSTPTSTRR